MHNIPECTSLLLDEEVTTTISEPNQTILSTGASIEVQVARSKDTDMDEDPKFTVPRPPLSSTTLKRIRSEAKKPEEEVSQSPFSRPPLSSATLRRIRAQPNDSENKISKTPFVRPPISSMTLRRVRSEDKKAEKILKSLVARANLSKKTLETIGNEDKPGREKIIKSPITRPPISSFTMKRRKEEKLLEEEFESLLASKQKIESKSAMKKQHFKVSKADEEEIEFILSGKSKRKSANSSSEKTTPPPPPLVNDARPESTYLDYIEINESRKSIFRPSSVYLSIARKDRALKNQGTKLLRKEAQTTNLYENI